MQIQKRSTSQALDLSEANPIVAIVDDDDAVRDATAGLVRSLGYSVSTFTSADEFLKSQHLDDTSCLITDVQMPGLSGLDLQDRLAADGRGIPIIFVTGYPNEAARARAMKAGAVAFLAKPFGTLHLVGYLEKTLKPS
jgi:FixJ family two-component response regulator